MEEALRCLSMRSSNAGAVGGRRGQQRRRPGPSAAGRGPGGGVLASLSALAGYGALPAGHTVPAASGRPRGGRNIAAGAAADGSSSGKRRARKRRRAHVAGEGAAGHSLGSGQGQTGQTSVMRGGRDVKAAGGNRDPEVCSVGGGGTPAKRRRRNRGQDRAVAVPGSDATATMSTIRGGRTSSTAEPFTGAEKAATAPVQRGGRTGNNVENSSGVKLSRAAKQRQRKRMKRMESQSEAGAVGPEQNTLHTNGTCRAPVQSERPVIGLNGGEKAAALPADSAERSSRAQNPATVRTSRSAKRREKRAEKRREGPQQPTDATNPAEAAGTGNKAVIRGGRGAKIAPQSPLRGSGTVVATARSTVSQPPPPVTTANAKEPSCIPEVNAEPGPGSGSDLNPQSRPLSYSAKRRARKRQRARNDSVGESESYSLAADTKTPEEKAVGQGVEVSSVPNAETSAEAPSGAGTSTNARRRATRKRRRLAAQFDSLPPPAGGEGGEWTVVDSVTCEPESEAGEKGSAVAKVPLESIPQSGAHAGASGIDEDSANAKRRSRKRRRRNESPVNSEPQPSATRAEDAGDQTGDAVPIPGSDTEPRKPDAEPGPEAGPDAGPEAGPDAGPAAAAEDRGQSGRAKRRARRTRRHQAGKAAAAENGTVPDSIPAAQCEKNLTAETNKPTAGSDKLTAGSDKLTAGSDKLTAGSDKLTVGSGKSSNQPVSQSGGEPAAKSASGYVDIADSDDDSEEQANRRWWWKNSDSSEGRHDSGELPGDEKPGGGKPSAENAANGKPKLSGWAKRRQRRRLARDQTANSESTAEPTAAAKSGTSSTPAPEKVPEVVTLSSPDEAPGVPVSTGDSAAGGKPAPASSAAAAPAAAAPAADDTAAPASKRRQRRRRATTQRQVSTPGRLLLGGTVHDPLNLASLESPDSPTGQREAKAKDPLSDLTSPGPDAALSGPDAALSGPDAALSGPDAALSGPDAALFGPDAALSGPDAALSGPAEVARPAADAKSGAVRKCDDAKPGEAPNDGVTAKRAKTTQPAPSTQLAGTTESSEIADPACAKSNGTANACEAVKLSEKVTPVGADNGGTSATVGISKSVGAAERHSDMPSEATAPVGTTYAPGFKQPAEVCKAAKITDSDDLESDNITDAVVAQSDGTTESAGAKPDETTDFAGVKSDETTEPVTPVAPAGSTERAAAAESVRTAEPAVTSESAAVVSPAAEPNADPADAPEGADKAGGADGEGADDGDADADNGSDPEFDPRKAQFQYGNYNRYYGYRNGGGPDARLACLKPEWFRGLDVLDVGCNIGHVTLTVARDLAPRRCVGLDIDSSLIKIARKNVKHYRPPLKDGTAAADEDNSSTAAGAAAHFPDNVSFVHANFVLESDALLETIRPEFDTVLCLSITKWVHLNFGDAGMRRFLRRVYLCLKPGGRLLLEPQTWSSYLRYKKLTPQIAETFGRLWLRPRQFPQLLQDLGFLPCQLVGQPDHTASGFSRQLQLFVKPAGGQPSAVIGRPRNTTAPEPSAAPPTSGCGSSANSTAAETAETAAETAETAAKKVTAVDVSEAAVKVTAVDVSETAAKKVTAVDVSEAAVKVTAVDVSETAVKKVTAVDVSETAVKKVTAVDVSETAVKKVTAVDVSETAVKVTGLDVSEAAVKKMTAVDATEAAVKVTAVDASEAAVKKMTAVDASEVAPATGVEAAASGPPEEGAGTDQVRSEPAPHCEGGGGQSGVVQ